MAKGKPMTKNQVLQHFAEKFGFSKGVALEVVDGYTDLIVNEVKKNDAFMIPGIGKVVKVKRKARMARNPRTGEQVKVPAKKAIKMRISKKLKDAVLS